MATAPYDPGSPTAVRMIDEQHFEVDSFRGAAKSYRVNLETKVCDCPHYAARLAGTENICKHYEAVKIQAPFLKALARAKELTDEALDQYLAKYAANPIVGGALRVEKQARRQQALRLAPIGTSTKLYGPLDDAAAFRGGSNWAGQGEAAPWYPVAPSCDHGKSRER